VERHQLWGGGWASTTPADNPLFRAFAAVVETALDAYFTLSTPMTGDAMIDVVTHHAMIADAIERQDRDAAASAMISVIDDGFSRIRV
jgi:DNA-binding FadR family transcriptional regulator